MGKALRLLSLILFATGLVMMMNFWIDGSENISSSLNLKSYSGMIYTHLLSSIVFMGPSFVLFKIANKFSETEKEKQKGKI